MLERLKKEGKTIPLKGATVGSIRRAIMDAWRLEQTVKGELEGTANINKARQCGYNGLASVWQVQGYV